ncbi:MAG: protein-disulfide reductase DsbD N-terminal domain-containing protein [Burkholderiales bacterium]
MKLWGFRTWLVAMIASWAFWASNVVGAADEDDLLEPQQAFRFSARLIDPVVVEVRYVIAAGYYMYRNQFKFSSQPETIKWAAPKLPRGIVKQDEFFGRVETYRDDLTFRVRFQDPVPETGVEFSVISQGCADVGVCYTPLKQTANLRPGSLSVPGSAGISDLMEKLRGSTGDGEVRIQSPQEME